MKTYDEILSEMKEDFYSLSGTAADDAADIGIRLKVLAGQLFALYTKLDWAIRQAFPQTACGEYLTLHALERGIERKRASAAVGEITFLRESEASSDILIPAGTICSSEGADAQAKRFYTLSDAVLPAGELSVTVSAMAQEAGRDYNAGAQTVKVMVNPPQGISSVINYEAFTGGSDEEDDDSLRERLLKAYSCISNGANAAFYRETALRHEGVGDANVIPRARGRGTVDVVVISPSNDIPEQSVIDELQETFDSLKEVGTDVRVYAANQIASPVYASIRAKKGYDINELKNTAMEAMRKLVDSVGIGQTLYLKDIYKLLSEIEGIDNCTVTNPSRDYNVPQAAKLVPFLVSVGELL